MASIGQALLHQTRDAAQGAGQRFRALVDLPGDVYRGVTGIPDERRLREYLSTASPALLNLAIPVVRGLANSGGASRKLWYAQPILLGKLFGLHDYLQDRTEALLALPDVPASLLRQADSAAASLASHPDLITAAVRTLPCPQAIATLGSVDFWQATADDEFKRLTERVDGRYEAIAKTEQRLKRDLPLFRAAYILTYHTLAKLDPIASQIAKRTPGAIRAYQQWTRQRDTVARIADRLESAGVEIEGPTAINDLHHHDGDTVPSAPATAIEPRLVLGTALSDAGPSPTLATAPSAPADSKLGLRTSALPQVTAPEPGRDMPPRAELKVAALSLISTQLKLHDPGLGPDPLLAPIRGPGAGHRGILSPEPELDTRPALPATANALRAQGGLTLPSTDRLPAPAEPWTP